MVDEKRCNFVVLYRSPSQDHDEFDSFSELILGKLAYNTLLQEINESLH